MSQPGFGVVTRGLCHGMVWCHDMTFSVATMTLQWKTEVCHDRVFSMAIGFGCWFRDTVLVSRQGWALGQCPDKRAPSAQRQHTQQRAR